MFIIRCKRNEAIRIGDITVRVLDISDRNARFAVDAPARYEIRLEKDLQPFDFSAPKDGHDTKRDGRMARC